MLPFKANYGYILRTLLILRQVRKVSKSIEERIEKLIDLH